jgi:RimJ/RimL family protein N-acetyltransferase
LAIEERDGRRLIGDCGPTVQEADGECYVELGWHVLRARQRRGIATEAGAACRDAAFAALDVPFLISLIRPENLPSRRVAEKLGFDVWRGTIRAGWGHLIYRLDRPAG